MEPADQPPWLTIAACRELQKALLLRSVLEAEGIEGFLPDELGMQAAPWLLLSGEGLRIQVRPAEAERAAACLAAARFADPEQEG